MLRTARSLLRCAGRHLTDSARVPAECAMKNRWVACTRLCSTGTDTSPCNGSSKTPRRAVLYVPGHSEKMLRKLTNFKVDCAVMECEDGVAVNKKAEAREMVCHMLDSLELPLVTDVAIRINSMESGFAEDDLSTILKAQRLPDTVFFPKVDSVEHIYWLVRQLKYSLRDRDVTTPLKIIIYAESAIALLRLPEIISEALELFESEPFCLDGVVFGSDDYCASIDQEGLQKYSQEGAMMGFTGKQVIHPSQVAIVQQAFSPSPERIEWATELLAGFQEHQQTGQGAFMFRGSMIDMPLVLQARNIMELAKIDASSGS